MSDWCLIPILITEVTENIRQFKKFLINFTIAIDDVYGVRVNRRSH